MVYDTDSSLSVNIINFQPMPAIVITPTLSNLSPDDWLFIVCEVVRQVLTRTLLRYWHKRLDTTDPVLGMYVSYVAFNMLTQRSAVFLCRCFGLMPSVYGLGCAGT